MMKQTSSMHSGNMIERSIRNANALANQVQVHYVDNRRSYVIKNRSMTLGYALNRDSDQQISYINNNNGQSYIENTMDAFVSLSDGTTAFLSKTSVGTKTNIFRYGYYYYEARLEEQDFANGICVNSEFPISHTPKYTHDLSNERISDAAFSAKITSKSDPFIVFEDLDLDTDKYRYLKISARIDDHQYATGCVHIVAGDMIEFSYLHNLEFELICDGYEHTYIICLKEIGAYTGKLRELRLDIDGLDIGQSVEIYEISLLDAYPTGAPTLSAARIFHTYSDKLHHVLQVAAAKDTDNIAAIGLKTEIATDRVDKLIIKDRTGLHKSLDDVEWASAEYIGFDIKDAGIFGYILPNHTTSGALEVTLDGDKYVIIQSRTPENNTVLAGKGTPKNSSTYICSEAHLNGRRGIKKIQSACGNDNDFFIGQRIYTDESHSFDDFLIEAEIERNPLTNNDIFINKEKSDEGEFKGYDALRGSYEFHIKGSDFNTAYYQTPNEKPALNFTVQGNMYDRSIYVLAATEAGALECAALLDENQLMLPIPIEVAKNFCGDGEENIYMRLDTAYGEAIFPLSLNKDDVQDLTVLHLYQNWGRFPLKQLSSIQYHAPYYHLSTGVTETNCIVPWRHTKDARIQNILPDHRAMSAPLWPSQPQHTSGGTQTFLHYLNEKGDVLREEVVRQTVNSYGPTYAELDMEHITYDGKIKVTYQHAEMPQTDENRAYYVMTYEFLDDIDFKDFKNEWDFYNMGKNTHLGDYTQIGYLDSNNMPTVISAKGFRTPTIFTLGDNAPYFSFFNMRNPENNPLDYVNLSFLIKDAEFVIDGVKASPSFALRAFGTRLYLTLDLDKVSFKNGDLIKINAIIMPWGSQMSVYDSHDFAPDQNVRNVRENSILNPVVAIADNNCKVIPSPFMPKLRSTNGKGAEFTISGGENNIAVRIYGFDKLKAPIVYEKADGEWVNYSLSSQSTPDRNGYAHSFDGYNVFYDTDGTYSYSFVVKINGGKERTFKIEA